MKITYEPPVFKPVTLVFETEEELNAIICALNIAKQHTLNSFRENLYEIILAEIE